MMPSYFICHGAPTLAVEKNDYTLFLKSLGQKIGKPKAIVIFTAHWESEVLSITSNDNVYETIYDFSGFPRDLFTIKYPAKGSSAIAGQLQKQFEKHGIPTRFDMRRGLDHGSWVVLRWLFPKADIPVVQLSVNPYLTMEEQYKIGQAISALREEDILVLGSGGTVHNLRSIIWGKKNTVDWAEAFDDWIIEKVIDWDVESLFDYRNQAPQAKMAVPRSEHFVPFFVAMGSGDNRKKAELLHRGYDFGTLSYLCYEFS